MKENERHRVDELLDLLAEEVAERLRSKFWVYSGAGAGGQAEADRPARAGDLAQSGESAEGDRPAEGDRIADGTSEQVAAERAGPESEGPDAAVEEGGGIASVAPEIGGAGIGEAEAEPETAPGDEGDAAPEETGTAIETGSAGESFSTVEAPASPPVPSHTARLLGRLALGLVVAVVLINIPFNRHGTTLATAMPDNRALVIRNGLVVKEEDDPEIYVYEDGVFRWISSLDAFEARGYTWEDVHVVEDGFLEDYAMGPPIHVLVKCNGSPHIYRVEGEKKRWIVDIEAFEAAGHVWEDVQFVSCGYIRSLPNGETIPPGHGPAPEP